MLARCKKLEIGLASRTAHHQKLFNFLKTAAGPPVLWLPAFVSAGMQQLLDARSGEFVSWQASAALVVLLSLMTGCSSLGTQKA